MKLNLDVFEKLLELNSFSTNKLSVDEKQAFIWHQISTLPLTREIFISKKFGDLMIVKTQNNNPEKPSVGICLHVDTVYPPEQDMPISRKDGKIFGPGAVDMQGSIFVILNLLHKLHEQKQLTNLTIIFNTCEEKGSPDFREIIKKVSKDLDICLVTESSDYFKDQKGNKIFDPKQFVLATARKGIFQQKIRVTGPGGHSGMLSKKTKRKNAIELGIKIAAEINNLANYEKGTTVNLAYIHGGRENTVIAEDCEFTFDVRFITSAERERVKQGIEEILASNQKPGLEVSDLGYTYDLPSLDPNPNTETLLKKAQEIGKAHGFDIMGEPRGGWADGCNIYHFNPNVAVLDGFGPHGDGEHSKDEFVYEQSLESSIELLRVIVGAVLS